MFKKLTFLCVIFLVISGCEAEKPKRGGGKFGMLDTDNPEFAATDFFNEIYHKKGLSGAIKLSTPKMERLLRSYHTNRGVQRHVLNMRFDKVEMQPGSRSAGRNEFAKAAKITLFFKGELDGDIIKDMRVIDLVRVDKKWKVDKVSME